MGRVAIGVVCASGLALGAQGCLSPTEITVSLTTDIPCTTFTGDSLYAGDPPHVGKGPITSQQGCGGAVASSGGGTALGTFVLAPAGDDSATVSILVIASAVSGPSPLSPDECAAKYPSVPASCIVTERTLAFVPHTPLTLQIDITSNCLGVACSNGLTCVEGTCQSPHVTCSGHTCVSPEAGATDGGRSDASDASRDAPHDRPGVSDAADVVTDAPSGSPSVLMYGGSTDCSGVTMPNVMQDPWSWDGTSWTRLPSGTAASLPEARYLFPMATLGGQTVMFGGYDGTGGVLGDTQSWNGTAWSTKSTTGIYARAWSAMAPQGDHVVLFGGIGSTSPFGDTWTWRASGWMPLTTKSSPPARFAHAMATLGYNVVLYGGTPNFSTDDPDTWIYDGANWTQLMVTGPGARDGHAMATLGSTVVLFGGERTSGGTMPMFTVLGDTWVWDGKSWSSPPITGKTPPARAYSAMAALDGHHVVLFGGTADFTTPLNDTWVWDGTSWTSFPAVAGGPLGRCGQAMATRP